MRGNVQNVLFFFQKQRNVNIPSHKYNTTVFVCLRARYPIYRTQTHTIAQHNQTPITEHRVENRRTAAEWLLNGKMGESSTRRYDDYELVVRSLAHIERRGNGRDKLLQCRQLDGGKNGGFTIFTVRAGQPKLLYRTPYALFQKYKLKSILRQIILFVLYTDIYSTSIYSSGGS